MTVNRESDHRDIESVLAVLRRRWWVIAVCVLVVGVSAGAFSLIQRKQYTASASLLFENPGFDQMLFGTSVLSQTSSATNPSATSIDLLSLPIIAARTSAALHGEVTPGQVKSEVSVSAAGQSNVANIAVTDPSPSRAAAIANTYAQQFILNRQEADRASIVGAQRQIQRELSELKPAQRNGSVGQSLINRGNELRTLGSLQTGDAELVQPSGIPDSPSSPRTKRNIAIGIVLGLLLGVGLAFLLERLDRRLRDPSALEDAYAAPVLGVIPESAAYRSSPRDSLPAADSEAFALLRARLRYFNVDRDVRSLLITSASAGEGKTTVALHLALAEAAAARMSVILIEADLRRPSIVPRLGLNRGPGLAEFLSRNVTLDEAMQHFSVPSASNGSAPKAHLTVITAGATPPNPAELIESRAMTELLVTLSERFDHVIIDSPPTAIVSDAIPLVGQVSGVVIVSRVSKTTRDSARHLREQLAKLHAPTLGVVANAVPDRGRGYYGYGAYEYQHYTGQEAEPDITLSADPSAEGTEHGGGLPEPEPSPRQ
jgi:receptor protein-tyrosine kinase